MRDILDAGNRIATKTNNVSLADFLANPDIQDIVMRQITIMGEAARIISDQTKERFSNIPWHKISGMRNRLVHEYRDIDYEEVWKTAKSDVPKLVRQIDRVLSEL
ncbi:DUF86 domain-containing protein [candidate division KSB1 bacterium]|nr:DUF86 domain-containing protein [candidate division KSB1 bacterium]